MTEQTEKNSNIQEQPKHLITIYEQLNLRSRWYSSQLWYVPFAYVGIVGLFLKEIATSNNEVKSFGYLFLAAFSLAVYVHVLSLKYYERRAVAKMQKIEEKIYADNGTPSGGGSPWYLTYITYINTMIVIAIFAFLSQIKMFPLIPEKFFILLKCLLNCIAIIVIVVVGLNHKKRNRLLRKHIHETMFKGVSNNSERLTTSSTPTAKRAAP